MKFKYLTLSLLFGASLAFGAGEEFKQVGGVIEGFDGTVGTTGGMILRTAMAWLPVILFFVGMLLGLKHSKNQADQDKENNKVWITVGGAGIAGAVIAILVDALIGAFLLQDSMKGLQVMKDYWLKALGL